MSSGRTRSDVFGGAGFLEHERMRTVSLNRLSQQRPGDDEDDEEGHSKGESSEYENPLLYHINATTSHMTDQSKLMG